MSGVNEAERRAELRWGALVVTVFLVAGVGAGFLWERLAAPVAVSVKDGRPYRYLDVSGTFDQVGVFIVITGALGLVLGVGFAALGRRRYRTTTPTVLLGSLLAAPVAYLVGRALGPETPAGSGNPEGVTLLLPLSLRGLNQDSPLTPLPDSTLLVCALLAMVGLAGVFLCLPSRGDRPMLLAPAQPPFIGGVPLNDSQRPDMGEIRTNVSEVETERGPGPSTGV